MTCQRAYQAELPWSIALPYGTCTPGIGKANLLTPEDFVVEEVASYLPCEQGEHTYLWIEKRLLTSVQVQQYLARHCQIAAMEIGMAGLKDCFGVTRQWFSVPARVEPALATFDHPKLKVLAQHRHGNKLRMGHLKGNRFRIVLHGVPQGSLASATATMEQLLRDGMLNGYGPQRFDRQGDGLACGYRLLKGQRLARTSRRMGRRQQRFVLSVLQAALFNSWLLYRHRLQTTKLALPGDILQRHASGGLFVCKEPVHDSQRLLAGEITPTGPMFGANMLPASDEAGAIEQWLLRQHGLCQQDWRAIGHLAPGTRRALWVKVEQADVTALSDNRLLLTFFLPAGAYASLLLNEVCKVDLANSEGLALPIEQTA